MTDLPLSKPTATARQHTMNSEASSLDALWMPFTANRQFRQQPRMLNSAEGMYYQDDKGRLILDGCAGLWCVNAGHGRQEISDAVARQVAKMDYAPPFQMGHPLAFEFAERLADIAPGNLNHVFFTNSGSESVETALKIALGYHRIRGEGTRQRLVGRERGYHGVNFGGISVGGIGNNRTMFGNLTEKTCDQILKADMSQIDTHDPCNARQYRRCRDRQAEVAKEHTYGKTSGCSNKGFVHQVTPEETAGKSYISP